MGLENIEVLGADCSISFTSSSVIESIEHQNIAFFPMWRSFFLILNSDIISEIKLYQNEKYNFLSEPKIQVKHVTVVVLKVQNMPQLLCMYL